MQFYELATLVLPFGKAKDAAAAAQAFSAASQAPGSLLGCWFTDIGDLNRLIVMRGFADQDELQAERQRTLMSSDPFGCGEMLVDLSMESYAPLPFMPPVRPGAFGAVYEIRTYALKTGGLRPTIEAWENALPARTERSVCVAAMYALDGTPRFTQLWPYADLNERARVRAETVAGGIWPPKGGPQWLRTDMCSLVCVPMPGSPLH